MTLADNLGALAAQKKRTTSLPLILGFVLWFRVGGLNSPEHQNSQIYGTQEHVAFLASITRSKNPWAPHTWALPLRLARELLMIIPRVYGLEFRV